MCLLTSCGRCCPVWGRVLAAQQPLGHPHSHSNSSPLNSFWFDPTYSISDDNTIQQWDTKSKNPKVTTFKEFKQTPTCLDWLRSSRGQGHYLAVGFADGTIQLINQNGQTDKAVQKAHNGAVGYQDSIF